MRYVSPFRFGTSDIFGRAIVFNVLCRRWEAIVISRAELCFSSVHLGEVHSIWSRVIRWNRALEILINVLALGFEGIRRMGLAKCDPRKIRIFRGAGVIMLVSEFDEAARLTE